MCTAPRLLFGLALGLLGSLLSVPACHAADPRIEAILKDWRERRKGIETVRYVGKGKWLRPKGILTGDPDLPRGFMGEFPKEDLWGKAADSWTFDFKNGRFRFVREGELLSLVTLQPEPHWRGRMFDGRDLWIYEPEAINGKRVQEIQKNPPTGLTFVLFHQEMILLLSHGTFTLNPERKARTLFDSEPNLNHLFFDGTDQIGDRQVTVLRYSPFQRDGSYHRIFVDTERQSSVLCLSSYWDNRKSLEVQADVDQFEGRWLPKRLKSYGYTTHGPVRLQSYSELEIVERKLNEQMPLSDFQPPKSDR